MQFKLLALFALISMISTVEAGIFSKAKKLAKRTVIKETEKPPVQEEQGIWDKLKQIPGIIIKNIKQALVQEIVKHSVKRMCGLKDDEDKNRNKFDIPNIKGALKMLNILK